MRCRPLEWRGSVPPLGLEHQQRQIVIHADAYYARQPKWRRSDAKYEWSNCLEIDQFDHLAGHLLETKADLAHSYLWN